MHLLLLLLHHPTLAVFSLLNLSLLILLQAPVDLGLHGRIIGELVLVQRFLFLAGVNVPRERMRLRRLLLFPLAIGLCEIDQGRAGHLGYLLLFASCERCGALVEDRTGASALRSTVSRTTLHIRIVA